MTRYPLMTWRFRGLNTFWCDAKKCRREVGRERERENKGEGENGISRSQELLFKTTYLAFEYSDRLADSSLRARFDYREALRKEVKRGPEGQFRLLRLTIP